MKIRECKHCGSKNNALSAVEDGTAPSAGDVNVCFKCGEISLFDNDLDLLEIDERMLEILKLEDPEQTEKLLSIKKELRDNYEKE